MVIELLVEHFKNHRDIEVIFDLAHEDVDRILRKTGFLSTRSEEAYFCAVGIVRHTLTKKHLLGVNRFYSLQPKEAIKWLIARLSNTVKSVLTDINHPHYLGKRVMIEDDFSLNFNHYLGIELEIDLLKLSPAQIQEGLKKIWKDGIADSDFDWIDFVEICQKYQVNPDFIIDSKHKAIVNKNGCSQLYFDFKQELK